MSRASQKTHALRDPGGLAPFGLRTPPGTETLCGRTVAGSLEIDQYGATCPGCARAIKARVAAYAAAEAASYTRMRQRERALFGAGPAYRGE